MSHMSTPVNTSQSPCFGMLSTPNFPPQVPPSFIPTQGMATQSWLATNLPQEASTSGYAPHTVVPHGYSDSEAGEFSNTEFSNTEFVPAEEQQDQEGQMSVPASPDLGAIASPQEVQGVIQGLDPVGTEMPKILMLLRMSCRLDTTYQGYGWPQPLP